MNSSATEPNTAGGGQPEADRSLLKAGEPQSMQMSPALLRLLVGAKQYRRMTNPQGPSPKEKLVAAAYELNKQNEGVVSAKSPESIVRRQQREEKKARIAARKAARQEA